MLTLKEVQMKCRMCIRKEDRFSNIEMASANDKATFAESYKKRFRGSSVIMAVVASLVPQLP